MRKIVAIASIALISMFAGSSECHPSKHRREHAISASGGSASHQTASVSPTFFINEQLSPKGESESAAIQPNKGKEEASRSWPDWIIAIFTIILAGSTIGLWFETKRLAKEAERSAKISMKLQEGALALSKRDMIIENGMLAFPLVYENVGSTNISIVHYDQHSLSEFDFNRMKASPIPVHLAGYGSNLFNASLIVKPGNPFGVGKFEYHDEGMLLLGGVIYKDVFDDFKFCPVSISVGRDGQIFAQGGVDFSLWEARCKELSKEYKKNKAR